MRRPKDAANALSVIAALVAINTAAEYSRGDCLMEEMDTLQSNPRGFTRFTHAALTKLPTKSIPTLHRV